jgi:GNAT superfamily N-acetyltransferase
VTYALETVTTKKQWAEFISLPWDIYAGDRNWVPPLRVALKDALDERKNPFFKHAVKEAWLVRRDSDRHVVGRVVGVVDRAHDEFHGERLVFFGYFEAIDDPRVTAMLLDAVRDWGRARGQTTLRGPVNLSTNHECGLLVEGFDDPPAVMMTYNPPYYAAHFQAYGLAKAKDLYAYDIAKEGAKFANRLVRHADQLRERGRVTFRTPRMKDFWREVDLILDIYNDAWEKNWGFVPMTREEFRHLAKDLKMILDPRLLLIAEVDGRPAGFAVTLPDVNQAIHKIRDGRLLPTGLFKLLWHIQGPGRKKTIKRCRIITLGIKRGYQAYGIGPLLYTEYLRRGPELGYESGEASWILEDNRPMNQALRLMNGRRNKVYRIYDLPLS